MDTMGNSAIKTCLCKWFLIFEAHAECREKRYLTKTFYFILETKVSILIRYFK